MIQVVMRGETTSRRRREFLIITLLALLFMVSCVNQTLTLSVSPVASSTEEPPLLLNTLREGCQLPQLSSGDSFDGVGLMVGQRAINFKLRDVYGTEFELSQLLARKAVVMIFGSCT
jgi:hypothetical protein